MANMIAQSSLTTLDHRISYISISAVASGSNGDIGMLHRKEHVTFSCWPICTVSTGPFHHSERTKPVCTGWFKFGLYE